MFITDVGDRRASQGDGMDDRNEVWRNVSGGEAEPAVVAASRAGIFLTKEIGVVGTEARWRLRNVMENQLKGREQSVMTFRTMRLSLTGPRDGINSLSPECLENSSEQSGHDACVQP